MLECAALDPENYRELRVRQLAGGKTTRTPEGA